eukprot:CAMPEP_0194272040 /NCGR_PEP_ID=MMETSP0169-20130528/5697_1 /TAXON_ID=218684 /ORGANISM="Corethron pennatum, Strain L29A3" /LENGTH=255 /DNA_ID=CAMNT_0039014589 /DNA_START=68 /DNA_END=835 /DNA_ORIENTATION=+
MPSITRSMTVRASGPAYTVGTTICKKFDDKFFSGTVKLVIEDDYGFLYRVVYEDDDREDLTGDEIAALRIIDLTGDFGEDSDAPSPDRTVRYDYPSEDEGGNPGVGEAVFHDKGADKITEGLTSTPQTFSKNSARASQIVQNALQTRTETTQGKRGECRTSFEQLEVDFLSLDIREGSERNGNERSTSEISTSESSASDSEEDRLTPKTRPEWTQRIPLKMAVAEQCAEQDNGTATIDPYAIFPDVSLLTPNKFF